MIEMANKSCITKVSRVFPRNYAYTSRVGKKVAARLASVAFGNAGYD
jgi:hypothetical protein